MASGLSDFNRALNLIPKRAETRQATHLRDTFVDSGVAAALEAIDHQVVYGRRGTGKTHALRYLETVNLARNDVAVYIDLRTVGSPQGLFQGEDVPASVRAGGLLVDLLNQFHDGLLTAVISNDELISDQLFTRRLDELLVAISSVRVGEEVELSIEDRRHTGSQSREDIGLSLSTRPSVDLHLGTSSSSEAGEVRTEARHGIERPALNFTDVARALRELAGSLSSRRIWLLLDEWSSVPTDVQPYLGEFLVRCVLPLQMFTVKIAAIEQQTNFRLHGAKGSVGLELGADVSANVDLDEFMVFEQNEDKATEFFRGLFFKHLSVGSEPEERIEGLQKETDVIRLGFTDKRAFEELVRAAEGVPRDALNIAAKAGLRAAAEPISVPDIRVAARAWYHTDKQAALNSSEEAASLLNWIIDKVIRGKKARGFLVNQRSARASLLQSLFDSRVLHVVRRGYSAQDQPGERYDVYVIDYGAYVDLMQTQYAPEGLLPMDTGEYTDVPTQDLRAIRRAVLDLDEFGADAPLPS